MMPPDALERLRLARSEGVGPIAYRRLIRRYGDAGAALAALPALARAGGRAVPPRIPSARAAAREIEAVAARGGRHLFLDTDAYPPLLAALEDAPPVLAFEGDTDLLARPAIAIVGARNASLNGRRIAAELAEALAGAGYVVVSGLARGIDAAAHEGALRAGTSFAAIAGGLDRPYPPENAALQARLAAAGGVFAEAPLGTAPQARHFPRRNRIIAGLALGCVVVEAALRSGSLITARLAAEAGREVFAVPGSPRDPRCLGSNHLLRQGAHLTETLADILDNLPARGEAGQGRRFRETLAPIAPAAAAAAPDPEPMAVDDDGRAALLSLLGPAPVAVDELLRYCHLSPAAVMAALLELEIAGRVETLPGNRVAVIAGSAVS
jgi:DNA processing protein